MTALADRECRELLFQLRSMTLRTLRLLLAEEDGFKFVSTFFATVFENRHTSSQTLPAPSRGIPISSERVIQPL